jgi:hypothetical protein
VLEAEDEPRSEWFDDTIEYLGERYPELTPDELVDLRTIGQRYCKPAISRATKVETPPEGSAEAAGAGETSTEEEPVDAGEASAA